MSTAAAIGALVVSLLIAWGIGDLHDNSSPACTDAAGQRVECQAKN